ncbi:MAG: hypothetical protein ACK45E_03570, partial [Ignavibacteria bacterium]
MLSQRYFCACVLVYLWLLSATDVVSREIPQAIVKTAVNGVLTDTLNLRLSPVNVQGRTITASTYNGVVPGVTWRVSPGDTIRVRLNNQLPTNPDQDSADQGNYPQRMNTTN